MRPLRVLAALVVLASLGAPAVAAGGVEGVPAAVRAAAEQHARDVAGVVAFEASAEMAIDAPMLKKRSAWRAWVIAKDGDPAETRLLDLTQEGKPASEAERAKLEAQMNDHKRKRDGLDLPLVRKFVADYTYEPAPCAGCDPGTSVYAFRARKRDKRHGDGTLTLGPDGRVRQVALTPCEHPPRVDKAAITLDAAPIGADWWGVRRFHARYEGGLGPLRGHMDLTQRQAGHRRFASLAAARAAAPR